jgi:hypothetical protein
MVGRRGRIPKDNATIAWQMSMPNLFSFGMLTTSSPATQAVPCSLIQVLLVCDHTTVRILKPSVSLAPPLSAYLLAVNCSVDNPSP